MLKTSFRKSCRFLRYCWKNTAEPDKPQRTIMAHSHCKLGNEGYNHSEYVILLFHYNIGCMNAPQCYVTRAVPVSLSSRTVAFLVLTTGTSRSFLINGATGIINTLRTGLLNCLNARSRGLTFRHRASCI